MKCILFFHFPKSKANKLLQKRDSIILLFSR